MSRTGQWKVDGVVYWRTFWVKIIKISGSKARGIICSKRERIEQEPFFLGQEVHLSRYQVDWKTTNKYAEDDKDALIPVSYIDEVI